tara:strand:- start:54 stop:224 length:171 start_codon:yes stop_codon:yes gene_type:complete
MPDKVTVTPASGKIEFLNDQSVVKASLELKETDDSSAGKDEVELSGTVIKGGSYST